MMSNITVEYNSRWSLVHVILLSVVLAVNLNTVLASSKKEESCMPIPFFNENIKRSDCKTALGVPTCCYATESPPPMMKTRGIGFEPIYSHHQSEKQEKQDPEACTITKTYISSPLELRELAIARSLSSYGNLTFRPPDRIDDIEEKRSVKLMDYLTDEKTVADYLKLLTRVHHHATTNKVTRSDDDKELLSRFHVVKTCAPGSKKQSWDEWIEPLTLAARHPFGLTASFFVGERSNTTNTARMDRLNSKKNFRCVKPDIIMSLDYLIVKREKDLHREELASGHTNQRHFLFDAGAGTFESSPELLSCAYAQREISFDDFYAWEYDVKPPVNFWNRVPENWRPFFHFYNIPVSNDRKKADSPLAYFDILKVQEHDFVSFKLDIDTTSIEVPMALEVLNNPALTKIVDEFFFELHFRCEFLGLCCWGKGMEEEVNGLWLERQGAMEFFLKLREKGIRSHFWP